MHLPPGPSNNASPRPRPRAAFPPRRVAFLIGAVLAAAIVAWAQTPQQETPQQPTTTATPAPNSTPASTPAPAPTTDAQHSSAPTTPTPAPQAPATPASTTPPVTPTAQQPAPSAAQAPAAQPSSQAEPPSQTPPTTQAPTQPQPPQPGAITEDELKRQLVGKQLYLRGGYLGDSLNFDEHGHIVGHPAQGSYTLSVIQLDHVRLTKHKVEFEGIRYGLHFNEQLAYEDSEKAYDKVRITPAKKIVKLTIDREIVVSPKKKKEKDAAKDKAKPVKPAVATPTTTAATPTTPAAPSPTSTPVPSQSASASTAPAATPSDAGELSEADQLKASIAATPEAERPADPNSVTTTTSQAHANTLLRSAIDAIFAQGLDERMMAAMPDFWKLYYQSVAAKTDYKPADPSVLRQNMVDQKARLLTSFEPGSNDFAQAAGVAGMSLYHTVIGVDGKPGEIAVARPIGFGLDENAVAAIRKAKFSPAIKNGQPVPVMLDLIVQFRIFSGLTNRTTQAANPTPSDAPAPDKQAGKTTPTLPGPYSLPHQ